MATAALIITTSECQVPDFFLMISPLIGSIAVRRLQLGIGTGAL
jgi:hypothetical protein